ncbi:MAG: TonB-dependent receptor [Alphaproteobacteria bacterium]|nr:TonB-dependent receptor [Alphaproteobacteria bacterium]
MRTVFIGGVLACAPSVCAAQANVSETIIVTARPDPEDPPVVAQAREDLSRTPGAVSVIPNESIERRVAQGFSDILRDAPGVLAQKRYGEESRLSIRGSGLDQSFHQRGVLLAQDGVPFADADGFSDFQKIDPLTARYVEVHRGGNALRFGGAQLGGAVNVVTPTGRTAQSQNLLRIEGGSYGLRRGAVQVARAGEDWDGFAALTALRTDGFRVNSSQEQTRGTLNVGYRVAEGRALRVTLYGADIHQEVPGTLTLQQALRNPEAAGFRVEQTDWKRDQSVFRASVQTQWRLNAHTDFAGGVYATATDLHHPIALLINQQIQTQGAFGRVEWAGELAGLRADLFAGASYRQGYVEQFLGPVFFPVAGDSRREAAGLDVFAEARLFVTDDVALVAGGSYGRATRDYEDRLNASNNASRDDDWFAPRIGVLWEGEGGAQIYANITKSVEPPHYGALVQAPNAGFVPVAPQEAWTGEIGTRGRAASLVWDITLYRAQLQNELLSFSPAAGVPAAVFNAGDTVHQGLELALDWRFAEGWALRQAYAYSDFAFDGDRVYGDNRLPVAPEHQYRASLTYAHASGWYLAPNVEWRPSDVYVDYANTLKAPGYALWGLNAGWDFANGVSAFVDARNLTDEIYVPEFGAVVNAAAPGSNLAVFYPGEGRSVYAGLSYRF